MVIFSYDKTFEGLLTCVFDAYLHHSFPDLLEEEGAPLPLFYDAHFTIVTDTPKSERVWKGLQNKISRSACTELLTCWRADLNPKRDILLFRYICKAIDAPSSIEVDFADPVVLELSRIYKQVRYERMRLIQFARFQKAADGTYFAPFEPQSDILPLAVDHFADRFGDQRWLIYDLKRKYGFFYDLHTVREVTFTDSDDVPGPASGILHGGLLSADLMDTEEKLFEDMWKTYFKAICIKERLNPRKHKQDMPVRYWKYLTEKQQ